MNIQTWRLSLWRIAFGVICTISIASCSTTNTQHTTTQHEAQPLNLYLLIGQSNMAGRAYYGVEDAAPIENVYLLNGSDEWESAKNPLNRYSTIRKEMSMQRLGPGYSFALGMHEYAPAQRMGLIVNAKGGSAIKEWDRDAHFYKEAMRRTKIAKKSGVLKGILWHQGETDFEDANYLAKLMVLIGNLREDLQQPNLPFVAGQINDIELINAQIAALPKHVPMTGFVSSEGLIAVDEWHFDINSVKLMGRRYAEQIQKLQQ